MKLRIFVFFIMGSRSFPESLQRGHDEENFHCCLPVFLGLLCIVF